MGRPKGYKASKETKQKMRLAKLGEKNHKFGKHLSNETKKKISLAKKGIKLSEEHKEKIRLANLGEKGNMFGKHHTEITKQKISLAKKGDKHPNWQGGKSFEPYGLEFNNELKEQIRERDQYRCQQCFRHQDELFKNTVSGIRPYRLCIHHIDYNKQNNNFDNLISLCMNCHMQTNFKREDWENYFKEKLN